MQTQRTERGTLEDAAEMVCGFNELIQATMDGGGQLSEREGRKHYHKPCTEKEYIFSAD